MVRGSVARYGQRPHQFICHAAHRRALLRLCLAVPCGAIAALCAAAHANLAFALLSPASQGCAAAGHCLAFRPYAVPWLRSASQLHALALPHAAVLSPFALPRAAWPRSCRAALCGITLALDTGLSTNRYLLMGIHVHAPVLGHAMVIA